MRWEPVCDARVYKAIKLPSSTTATSATLSRENRWRIVARWRGKVALRNEGDGAALGSISEWKVQAYELDEPRK